MGSRSLQQHLGSKLWKAIPSLSLRAVRKSLDGMVLCLSVGTLNSHAPAKLPSLLWNLALLVALSLSMSISSTSFARLQLMKSL
jgi:hypothetical protein